MENILITGSNGQLGQELKSASVSFEYKFFFLNKKDLDISDYKKVRSYIEKNDITSIINCAAYTAVDKAEYEKDLANKINNKSIENIAKISKELNIKLIHISTDYVFDGENYRPYLENDKTNPQTVYGLSKLNGENALIKLNPKNSIIIRTSWMYSVFGDNFVKTMIKLGKEKTSLNVIYDQIGTPTSAKDLALAILSFLPKISNDEVEIYNYSNEGVISWYDFAVNIMRIAKLDCEVLPIETTDYITTTKRPYYSLLNKSKIKNDYNLSIPYWLDSLTECIEKLLKNK